MKKSTAFWLMTFGGLYFLIGIYAAKLFLRDTYLSPFGLFVVLAWLSVTAIALFGYCVQMAGRLFFKISVWVDGVGG